MPLVFEYGSNCSKGRLNSPNRLNGHAEDRGRAQTIEDFDIVFDSYSQTNGCATSDLAPTPGRKVWGVLYEIPDQLIRGRGKKDQKTLEEIKEFQYEEKRIRVLDNNRNEHEVITFLVSDRARRTGLPTSAAYVSWIIYGLRDHGVPEDYITHVLRVAIETNEYAGVEGEIRLMKTL
jgi:AIG2 family protein